MEENYEIVDNEVYSELNDDNLVYPDNQNMSLKMNGVVADPSVHREEKKSFIRSESSKASKGTKLKNKSVIDTSSINKSNLIGISSLNCSKKNSSPTAKKEKKMKSMSIALPYGERLYRKSLALQEEKLRKNLDIRSSQERAVNKQCSFRPKINEESFMMSFKKTYTSGYGKFSAGKDYASSTSSPFNTTKTKKVVESYIKKKEEEELSELRPSKKKPSKEVEELANKLFKEAETLKVAKEREMENHYAEVCPFTPKISDSSKPKVENFYKRLQGWVEKRNENYQKEVEEANKDSKTGQKLFTPRISKRDQERGPRNVFIDLYEENKKLTQVKKETQEKKEEEISKLANSKKATDKMDEIVSTIKFECFLKLFQILDTDDDNSVSYNEHFLLALEKNLNSEIRGILEPLLNEFSLHNETLNKEEFVLALDQLYNVLNVDQKRKLVNWYVQDVKRENSPRKRRSLEQTMDYRFSFRPSISESSNKLYINSQRFSKDLLERNNEFLKKRESYIQEKNEEKFNSEIKGCTFRPSVSASPNNIFKA